MNHLRERHLSRWLASLITAATACTASAQTLQYRLGTGTIQNVANNQIDVGTLTSDTVLYIFDSATITMNALTGTSNLSTGVITIKGDPVLLPSPIDPPAPRLMIAIVDGDVPSDPTLAISWVNPPRINDPFRPGLRNLGGLNVVDSRPPNPNLGEEPFINFTNLIAWIDNDVTGPIDVGAVRTLDVRNTLAGNVTTHSSASARLNVPTLPNEPRQQAEIGRVRVGNLISGNLLARSLDFVFGVRGEIDTVLVGPSVTAAGITGDIMTEYGGIGSIFTIGPVGSAARTTKIWANDTGIKEIRAAAGPDSAFLKRDMWVDVRANRPLPDGDLGGSALNRVLGALTTDGNIYGYVGARVLQGVTNVEFPVGIRTTGVVDATIEIDGGLSYVGLIAGAFLQPIKIGQWVKAPIVAAIPRDTSGNVILPSGYPESVLGTMHSVSIGNGFTRIDGVQITPNVESTVGRGLINIGLLPSFQNPFTGTTEISGPFVPGVSLCSDGTRTCNWFFGQPFALDTGAPDSVVKAERSIGSVSVFRINEYFSPGVGNVNKFMPARIESPRIGSLVLQDVRDGGVWSGIRLADGTPDPNNLHTAIDDLNTTTPNVASIGTLGSTADLYLKDFTLVEAQAIYGELDIPSLEAEAVLRVDGALGVPADTTCGDFPNDPPFSGCYTQQPEYIRLPARMNSQPTAGLIAIRNQSGLKGQIILDAKNALASDLAWRGQVIVGSGTPSPIVLEPQLAQGPEVPVERRAPYYRMPSAMLGYGAVGEVPFQLYESDCAPAHLVRLTPVPNQLSVNSNLVDPTDFVGAQGQSCDFPIPVKIRFYGPISVPVDASGIPQLSFSGAPEEGPEICGIMFDGFAQSLFRVRLPGSHPDVNARTIGLSAAGAPNCVSVNTGKYRVGVVGSLTSLTGLTLPMPAPANFWEVCNPLDKRYYFRVGDAPTSCFGDIGDFNDDGNLTVQDIFDFLTAWFAGDELADVNKVGGVTVQDIFDFLAEWFNGCTVP